MVRESNYIGRMSKLATLGLIAASVLAVVVAFAGRVGARSVQTEAPAAPAPQASAPANGIVLDSSVTIVQPPGASGPIKAALADLASDLETVLGTRPRAVTRPEDAGAVAIFAGEQSAIPEAIRPAALNGVESFSISEHTAEWIAGRPTKVIVLAGADVRGTIFAIYQFSQEFLGVDPMYYWTGRKPARRASVVIDPAKLPRSFPSPVFKLRGFFINDEDLLTGWAPGAADHTGISLAVWNKIFETILRLHGNMIAPGTWIFPDDPQVRLASQRGLIIAQHHATPLGLNVARWPAGVPYNYTEHPEILERAWTDAVHSYLPGQEVVWSVGLRGLSDQSYAALDPAVRGNDKALGALVGKAIGEQMRIVRASYPNAQFITNLWQEGARLVHEGYLKIPPEVATVWADDGYGYLQDNGEVAPGQGAYFHVAMMNGRANQLSEMVPVEQIYSEMARYQKAGATTYWLINTSDIRPVVMSIRAVMDAAWRGVPGLPKKAETTGNANAQPAFSPAQAADDFYSSWARYEFGPKIASQIASVYHDYYAAPARARTFTPASTGSPDREYGDQLYHTEMRRMLLTYMIDAPLYAIPSQAPEWAEPRVVGPQMGVNASVSSRFFGKQWLQGATAREIPACSDAQPRWDALWAKASALESQVPPGRRNFYRAQVLAMIAINGQSNKILLDVSKAIQDAEQGNKPQAHQEVADALEAFNQIQRAESAAEYGQWKHWYRGDWLTGVYRSRQLVEIFDKFLDDPETHIAPPVFWDGWEAYYHIMKYEDGRTADVK